MATIRELATQLDPDQAGNDLQALVTELFPLCRSITGDGVRETLAILSRRAPLEIREVPTGTQVLDWTVPPEWVVREAWIAGPDGERVVDFRDSNLHLVGYSVPIDRQLPLSELRPHLHTLPEHPDWIPYRTSYYREDWGFCLAHRRLEALPEGPYRVRIDSELRDGHLTFGELLLAGDRPEEFLISTHVCHPSLANDNLSGIAACAALAEQLSRLPNRRWSYRFLFIPGTIGAITWLALNEPLTPRIRGGLVAANLGDEGPFTYQRSRRGDAEVDRALTHLLHTSGEPHEVLDFSPYGYDERQFNSPGFDLGVGRLTRSPHGAYPEYHTSADDLDLLRPGALGRSLVRLTEAVEILEGNRRYRNLNPKGEPQLGRRGLYGQLGGAREGRERELALLWVLNLSDGDHDLLAVAERSGMPFRVIAEAAATLSDHGLLAEVAEG